MEDDARAAIEDYISRHRYLRLATVSAGGNPVAHTVGYVSEGATVYFATFSQTRKVANIAANPRVAYTVDEDCDDWKEIRGVQMEGVAERMDDAGEIGKVAGLMEEKFPGFAEIEPGPEMLFFRIDPARGYFLDFSKGLNHREQALYRTGPGT